MDGSADDEFGAAGASGSGATRGGGGNGTPGGTGGTTGTLPVDPVDPMGIGGVTLPECELGPPTASADSSGCRYVATGNCYEDPEMACACACRGLADNRCIIGGFLNPDEPQTVRCTGR